MKFKVWIESSNFNQLVKWQITNNRGVRIIYPKIGHKTLLSAREVAAERYTVYLYPYVRNEQPLLNNIDWQTVTQFTEVYYNALLAIERFKTYQNNQQALTVAKSSVDEKRWQDAPIVADAIQDSGFVDDSLDNMLRRNIRPLSVSLMLHLIQTKGSTGL